jgi:hypothetical protein
MTRAQKTLRARAIRALVPTAQYAEVAGAIVRWDVADPQPSEADIAAEVARQEIAEAVGLYRAAVDQHIEAVARSRDYASSLHCVTYLHSTIAAWAAEAAAFVAWRDAVWIAVYAALDAWQAGGEAPTVEALIASLPPMEWPEA